MNTGLTCTIFITIAAAIASGYILVNSALSGSNEDDDYVHLIIGSALIFITWIYCLVLAVTAIVFLCLILWVGHSIFIFTVFILHY